MSGLVGFFITWRRSILLALLALLAVLALLAAGMQFRRMKPAYDPQGRHDFLIWRGAVEARAGQYDEAVSYLRAAIDEASSLQQRAAAALRMGQVLLNRAHAQSGPYAVMAQQYFLTVMDAVPAEDSLHREAVRSLFNAAIYTGDQVLFERVARQLVDVTTDPDEKEELYLRWIKNRMERGTYAETTELMQEFEKVMPDRTAKNSFGFLNVAIANKLLVDQAWHKEYGLRRPGMGPEALRAEIVRTASQWLGKKIETNPELRGECYFRMAKLYEDSGNGPEARKYIDLYLQSEPAAHLKEILLMTVRLLCRDGNAEAAEERMNVFINRYGLDDESEIQLAKLADLFAAQGKPKEAYALLGKALRFPLDRRAGPVVLEKASRIACRLERNADAWAHYRELVARQTTPGMNKDLLLAQADTCFARGDLDEAGKWVVTYLRCFPVDAVSAQGLFRLFDIRQAQEAPKIEILAIGLAAVRADITHPRAMPTIMATAQVMEDMGLYAAAGACYNRLALLGCLGSGTNVPVVMAESMKPAILGKARCLLKEGQDVKAASLLREICRRRGEATAVRSEAAYWWATIAAKDNQGQEALRRLNLMNTNGLDSSLVVRADIERKLAGVLTGQDWEEAMISIFARVSALKPPQQEECLQRVCRLLCAHFERSGNDGAIQVMLELAARSSLGKGPFIKELNFRFAVATIHERGAESLVEFIKPKGAGPSNAVQSVSLDDPVFKELYRQFMELQPEVAKYL